MMDELSGPMVREFQRLTLLVLLFFPFPTSHYPGFYVRRGRRDRPGLIESTECTLYSKGEDGCCFFFCKQSKTASQVPTYLDR